MPRLDRLVEIHPVWIQAASGKEEYQKPREHWEWLKKNREIPVYMMTRHPDVPMSVQYPLRDAMALVPPDRRRRVFTSSFDYLMALALVEGVRRIEVYGFEMGSDTEYRYQREGAAYWIATADALGVEVVLPDNTALLKNKLYGYEGGSMIYRQDMERMKEQRQAQVKEAYSRLSYFEGKMSMDDSDELKQKWNEQYKMCLILDGALQQIEKQLQYIDLEEPDDLFEAHMASIPILDGL